MSELVMVQLTSGKAAGKESGNFNNSRTEIPVDFTVGIFLSFSVMKERNDSAQTEKTWPFEIHST